MQRLIRARCPIYITKKRDKNSGPLDGAPTARGLPSQHCVARSIAQKKGAAVVVARRPAQYVFPLPARSIAPSTGGRLAKETGSIGLDRCSPWAFAGWGEMKV